MQYDIKKVLNIWKSDEQPKSYGHKRDQGEKFNCLLSQDTAVVLNDWNL